MTDEATATLFKSLAHPMRIRILRALGDGSSPSGLAAVLDLPLTHVSYHVRVLRGTGAIRLTREESRRGAIEHVYEQTPAARALLDALAAFEALT